MLTSARWRGRAGVWTKAHDTLADRMRSYSEGVRIVPSMVNFFAEHGALQITVVNDLDVEVRDIRLTADVAGRPSRLHILGTPEPLTIRPRSRATVRLDVEAIAAGVVPLTTSLRTAAGAPSARTPP
ncbi:DUF6049 family protein [Mobilicoccus caccae]|uniref:Uncharacterized protein n=1 Tax=Mobilicoccus caccae TaxID=1859295 RepID=A0ABQ6IWM2_9MICO|nr:DUF6049 family protein [Mobilicoccus caccae]GMA41826.1 hypothetical protein GCM10025883_38710 [Mobilicoccus caccae]